MIGGLLGLGIAAALGWLIYVGGRRIDLGTFFKVTGVLMVLFAGGLAAKAVHEFGELFGFDSGWLIHPMWNITSGRLAAGTLHDFFEGFSGWSRRPGANPSVRVLRLRHPGDVVVPQGSPNLHARGQPDTCRRQPEFDRTSIGNSVGDADDNSLTVRRSFVHLVRRSHVDGDPDEA